MPRFLYVILLLLLFIQSFIHFLYLYLCLCLCLYGRMTDVGISTQARKRLLESLKLELQGLLGSEPVFSAHSVHALNQRAMSPTLTLILYIDYIFVCRDMIRPNVSMTTILGQYYHTPSLWHRLY